MNVPGRKLPQLDAAVVDTVLQWREALQHAKEIDRKLATLMPASHAAALRSARTVAIRKAGEARAMLEELLVG